MDISDLEFWAFLAMAAPVLFLPVIIVWWKGRPVVPIALLSLVFWPGALILALRLRRRQDRQTSAEQPDQRHSHRHEQGR